MDRRMAIWGKGEGKAKAAAKEPPRVPRASGRLDWSMIYRNATSSDPEGLRVALLDMLIRQKPRPEGEMHKTYR